MSKVSNKSKVKIKFQNGEIKEISFAQTPLEIDPLNGKISLESPLAQALLGHEAGEKIKYFVNDKEIEVELIEVIE